LLSIIRQTTRAYKRARYQIPVLHYYPLPILFPSRGRVTARQCRGSPPSSSYHFDRPRGRDIFLGLRFVNGKDRIHTSIKSNVTKRTKNTTRKSVGLRLNSRFSRKSTSGVEASSSAFKIVLLPCRKKYKRECRTALLRSTDAAHVDETDSSLGTKHDPGDSRDIRIVFRRWSDYAGARVQRASEPAFTTASGGRKSATAPDREIARDPSRPPMISSRVRSTGPVV